jgi:hypothetical protein
MDRYTRKDAENALQRLVFALGGKIAKDYKDVHGYRLDHAYGGYNVERIVNEQGGVTLPFGMQRRTAREFVDAVRFALDVMNAHVEHERGDFRAVESNSEVR